MSFPLKWAVEQEVLLLRSGRGQDERLQLPVCCRAWNLRRVPGLPGLDVDLHNLPWRTRGSHGLHYQLPLTRGQHHQPGRGHIRLFRFMVVSSVKRMIIGSKASGPPVGFNCHLQPLQVLEVFLQSLTLLMWEKRVSEVKVDVQRGLHTLHLC